MKKGFTLLELLAVIVILAVISLIATPMILNVIETVRKSAAIESANGLMDAAEKYTLESMLNGESSIRFDFPEDTNLQYKGTKPESGTIVVDEEGNMSITVLVNGYCVRKRFAETTPTIIEIETCEIEEAETDITPPSTPVVVNDSTTDSSITVTATCNDMESGVKKIELSKDGGATYSTYHMVNGLIDFENYSGNQVTVEKVTLFEQDTLIEQYKLSRVNGSTNMGLFIRTIDRARLTSGKKYIWSLYLKLNRDINFFKIGHEQGGDITTNGLTDTSKWQKVSYSFVANRDTNNSFIIYGPFENSDSIYMHSLSLIEEDADNSIGTYQYTFDGLTTGTYNIKARCTSHNDKTSESAILQVQI